MDKIVLSGIPLYDGEYDLDVSYFTNREFHTIKRVAGVRAGELDEALAAGDTDLVVALAVIALERAGKNVEEDRIWEANAGSIEFVADAAVAADPTKTAPLPPPTKSSGDGSTDSSDPLVNGQSPTGSPRLETLTSDLVSGQAI